MTVTLSQKSYNALLDDLEKLRERNAELERKLDKEIKLSYEIEKNLYDTSKERDELINDMANLRERNAELEKKAKAFDEIVNAVDESANSYELVARIKLEVLKYQKLERGSDG